MSRPPIAKSPLSKLKNNSSFANARRPRLKGLIAGGTARRAGAFLALFAIIVTVFYTGSSSAASPRDKASAVASSQPVVRRPVADSGARPLLLSPFMFQLFPVDEVTLYAADCTTPKSDFNLGETVCARATFPPGFLSLRRLTWVDPSNNILDAAIITSSGQTSLFTLPGTGTSNISGDTVDNRGTWRVDLRWADGSRPATAAFDVHEPANPRADLQISAGSGNRTVESGASVTVKVVAYNAGPDAATNVEVSALSIPGLSLESFTDALNTDCGTGGVCSVASLPRGAHAVFVATYSVTAAGGTNLVAQATVTSDTEDPRPSSNSDSFSFTIAQATGEVQNCTLTPPQPITVNGSEIPDPNDPSQTLYGAIVTYAVDAEGDSCAPVQCDVPSGSSFPVGTTLVTCTAASGDSTTFPVTVIDTRSFQITLNGANPLAIECNSIPPFADPGATTNRPGVTPTVTSDVNPSVPGSYTITYTATDGTDTVTATRTVNVVDDSPPQITLNGDDPLTLEEVETEAITIECHMGFTDPGATANDGCNGPTPVTVNSNVDPNTVGTYTITYSATDERGTPGDPSDDLVASITRTVHVVDTTAPAINLTGGNVLTAECHVAFTDPGATATDACEGDLNSAVQVSGTVDPNTVGTYTLTYTVSDASGNTATAQRTVNVVDTTPPVITILGDNPAIVECHTSYTDAGATATDACGGVYPVTTSGSVDVNMPGVYTITYTSTDGTNTGTATRTVNVVDTVAPVISCPADIVVNLLPNSPAISTPVSFNVTASDDCGTASVTTTHASGANFPVGTTTVTATATDQSGNTSSCSFNVTVHYLFAGFFSPISNLPVLNTVKAGSAIPIKFSLSGNKGLGIFAADSPASGLVSCNSNDPVVDLTEIDTPGASGLSYNAASDQYSYNWKTLKAWEGTCRQLVVKLNDGTEHRANFKFK
ncbi:MAG TPA: immunoglobulin-like domain-containing protein [Pyrinomonadaceae bacterium]|nr:immunoglobulin-like domain-containing protein [Pyrinomonadaceae bacterium]